MDEARQQGQTNAGKAQAAEAEADKGRAEAERLLSRAVATEKQLEERTKEVEGYVARIQALDTRIEQGTAQLRSKDESLSKMAAARQVASPCALCPPRPAPPSVSLPALLQASPC